MIRAGGPILIGPPEKNVMKDMLHTLSTCPQAKIMGGGETKESRSNYREEGAGEGRFRILSNNFRGHKNRPRGTPHCPPNRPRWRSFHVWVFFCWLLKKWSRSNFLEGGPGEVHFLFWVQNFCFQHSQFNALRGVCVCVCVCVNVHELCLCHAA